MATIFRALMTAVLLLYGYVVTTGLRAGGLAFADGADPSEALALHLRVGLVVALVAVLAQSVPFAYFLGTGFWVKAFVRASRAGPEWEHRHALWMKGRAYPWMYAAPGLAAATAITGGLAETGRLPGAVHLGCVAGAILGVAVAMVLVPREMRRNSALMDELADRHQVPKPHSPEHFELIEHESKHALPPLFQLSRVLMYAGAQLLVVWLYLRFGTEGFRGAPFLAFALPAVGLLACGLGLNARHDPDAPRTAAAAWGRALLVGALGTTVVLLLPL